MVALLEGRETAPRRGPVSRLHFHNPLPPIEAVTARAFTSTNDESYEPQNEKDSGRYPQQMHRESGSKQNQNEQQCKDQYHRTTSLLVKSEIHFCLVRRIDPTNDIPLPIVHDGSPPTSVPGHHDYD